MNSCYVALGSNISPRYSYLQQAILALKQQKDIQIKSLSSIYETIPVGYTDQANFLNMVIEIETVLSPIKVLRICQAIEQDLGRKRVKRWGPRTIDLDILLYNQEQMETEQLIVPHPRIQERAFVMVPLHEINPNVLIPSVQESVAQVLAAISTKEKQGVVKWKEFGW